MLRGFFVIALHNLLKNKLFSLVNIGGLAIGLCASLMITFYVLHETSYDKHWARQERVFRVNTTLDLPNRTPYTVSTGSSLLAGAMQHFFPAGLAVIARTRALPQQVINGEKRFNDTVIGVDSSITSIFDFTIVAGDLQKTLVDANSIALSEEAVATYFGSENPLGKTLTLINGRAKDYRVGAVYRLAKGNTIVKLPAMIAFDEAVGDFEMQTWTRTPVSTWVLLQPGVSAQSINIRMNEFSDQQVDISRFAAPSGTPSSKRIRFDIRNIASLYLDASFEDGKNGGNQSTVQAFAAIAALVLLIGCINFTILSTARSALRAKETAVRKLAGASRQQLIVQYFGESLLLVSLAMLLALCAVELLLPVFAAMVGKDLHVELSALQLGSVVVLMLLTTGLAGGLYPALALSKGKPVSLLSRRGTGGSAGLHSLLVVFQFGVATALMIATAVIYLQVLYISRHDPGFTSRNVVVLDDLYLRRGVNEQKYALKEAIAALPQVQSVSLSSFRPAATTPYSRTSNPYVLADNPGETFVLNNVAVDEDYFSTYEMHLLAGRTFSPLQDLPAPPYPQDRQGAGTARSTVINESTARRLGFTAEQAIGKVLIVPAATPPGVATFIIGVVADNQLYTLRAPPRAEVYSFQPGYSDALAVRFAGSVQAFVPQLARVWQRVMGDTEFSAHVVDNLLAEQFTRERVEAKLLVSFAFLAIVIACLGLLGSAAFNVERRTKEIGIRKIMGAEVREILTLLLWQFTKPVLLANLIAWPLAVWAMLNWLQRFPYRIDTLLLIPLCVLAGAVALSITWLTVATNALRVATTNPVLALRHE